MYLPGVVGALQGMVVRSIGMVVVEIVAQLGRWAALRVARGAGTVMRLTSRGTWPVIRWLVVVAIALLILPPLINLALDVAEVLGVWSRLGVEKTPSVGDWWTPERVLMIAAGLLAVKWLLRARERVVVEEFMDYTSSDAKAVSGLAVLLVTELSRLRELYGHVNEQLSTPASVSPGAAGGGSAASTDPGAFLSVRADEITEVLSGAVASESKVTVGGITIPIGLLFSLVGRLARGPRVLGSVHLTDAGGGPTVTAQIVGRGQAFTWRVDAPEREAGTPAKAFLDPMVTEIACRMFTDMTLRGSVRWQAIRAFTSYLQLYWESLRTPKNRATFLKRAEGKLLEAVAEDETFDLAFYNLGVVYSQLAQTEYAAADAAEYPHKRAVAPDAAHRARTESALVAFRRAITLRRDRWEAIYALAVHEYARVEKKTWRPDEDERRRYDLTCIARRCERVLELDHRNAQACDLRGMAYLQLGQHRRAIRSHRAAVNRSWLRLCRAEYAERHTPPTRESILPSARANAAAALHNLAQAHWQQADLRRRGLRRRLRLVRADRVFHQALALAPTNSRAAMEFERGRMREGRRSFRKAADSYVAAIRIEPESPVYWAHLARAQAKRGDAAPACESARSALAELAPIYRRALEPHWLPTVRKISERTLVTLADAYAVLEDDAGRDRMWAIRELRGRIRELERPTKGPRQPGRLEALLKDFGSDRQFEREQVGLALARTLGAMDRWEEAAERYGALIEELDDERPAAIRQHALYAKRAKALRRAGCKPEALDAAARALVIDPISAVARRELGKAHFALLQYEEALDAWQHTLWLTPNDATLHWKAAFSLWSVAQDRQQPASRRAALEGAAAKFEQAAILFGIENVTGWAWSQLWLGRTRAELDEPDPAVKHLRAAKGCKATELASRMLLGEVYQATRDYGLSGYQLAKAEELCSGRTGEALGDKIDADWGETLTYREVLARVKLGLAHCAAESGNDAEAAGSLAAQAYALADEIHRQPRAKSLIQAHALALEAELDFDASSQDVSRLEEALAKIGRASRLAPAPDILLREVQLTEALVQSGATGPRRAQLIAAMIDDVRAIRRIDGDDGDCAREGELILRRWKPPAVSANGHAATLH